MKRQVHLWNHLGQAIPGPSFIRGSLRRARKDMPGLTIELA